MNFVLLVVVALPIIYAVHFAHDSQLLMIISAVYVVGLIGFGIYRMSKK
jgi:hypothetical protein